MPKSSPSNLKTRPSGASRVQARVTGSPFQGAGIRSEMGLGSRLGDLA
jgi:hypothetical protein